MFWQVRGFEFTGYDDEHYVTRNTIVAKGLTPGGIWWAFTTGYFTYWHPLTWISHMVDVELFGMNSGAHHMVSVFIHILNSIVLFLGLQYITGSWGKSAFVAALFALHPTRVESVAWIAERKDVLSGCFWVLTIWAYAWYTRRRGLWRYLTALFLFAGGLMSKPMVVTLPCVLLLMDYWPLRRLGWIGGSISLKRALLEKVPFFVGVLMSCAVTLYGVIKVGGIVPDERFSLALRVANTPVSYARYLGKLFWPGDLAVLYPMPAHWELWKVAVSTLLLVALTGVFLSLARRAPYLIVGWLWFLGTLVPTIGLISVGFQSIADRFTYLPFVGLFVMLAWGAGRIPGRTLIASVALVGCAAASWRQTGHWRNMETLFAQCVRVTANNAEAHYNLGLAQYHHGNPHAARRNFEEALRVRPQYEDARNNLSLLLLELGDPQGATNHLAQLLRRNPRDSVALLNMGRALVALGDGTQAKGYLELARSAEAHLELGRLLEKMQRTNEARVHFQEAERLRPGITSPPSPAAPSRP